MARFHFSACGYTVFSAPFIEETILSPLSILGSLVKYQLTLYAGVYFLALYFVPLAYVSIFMLVLYCFNLKSFVI